MCATCTTYDAYHRSRPEDMEEAIQAARPRIVRRTCNPRLSVIAHSTATIAPNRTMELLRIGRSTFEITNLHC